MVSSNSTSPIRLISNKIIKLFPEREDVQLLNGRWGPYLKIGKDNIKLPKGTEAETLSLEECLSIADTQDKAPAKGKRKPVKQSK